MLLDMILHQCSNTDRGLATLSEKSCAEKHIVALIPNFSVHMILKKRKEKGAELL